MSLQGEVRSTSVQESGSALRSILISFAITLVSLFGFATWSVGQAVTTITVNVGGESTTAGQTSLRDAINIANSTATPCPCLINFAPAVTSVIPNFALPDITRNDVTVDGGGTVALTSTSGQSFPGLTLSGVNGVVTRLGIGGFLTGVFITNNDNQVLTSTIGSPHTPNQNGIDIDDGIGNRIIGNSIVGNDGFAINLIGSAVGNEFLNNEIASNTAGGIELGVTSNDVGDVDTGFGNEGQNFASITSATLIGGSIDVVVDLDSSGVPATQSLLVEIFKGDGSFPLEQGAEPLGSQCFAGNQITGGAFTVSAGTVAPGDSLVATGTSYASPGCTSGNASDGTSEFSFPTQIAAGFVVNTTLDYPLPDGDANVTSLREAITEANAACGSSDCQVLFNIPTSDGGFNATEGTFNIVVNPALGALPPIQVSTLTIDGASQTAFSGDTNTAGPEIVINGAQLTAPASGLVLDGSLSSVSNCSILNLVIQGFPNHGIEIIGGLFTSGNLIDGNYIGTNATATGIVANGQDGVHIRDFVTGTGVGSQFGIGNVIGGNGGYGVYAGISSGNNTIQSNAIGTNAGGTLNLANGLGGIYLDSNSNDVGFSFLFVVDGVESTEESITNPADAAEAGDGTVGAQTHAPMPGGNVIAFNNGPGVLLDAGASSNSVFGNVIRENTGEGVLVTSTANCCNNITQNDIFLNGALGVDLGGTIAGGNGVTVNDGTSGTGPNDLADYPIITSAVYDGTTNTTTIQGTYTDPNFYSQTVRIEVFSNNAPDTSLFGEGEIYLGFVNVLMDFGPIGWTYNHTGDISGMFATANATLPTGSTSEFSEAVLIQALDVGIVKTGPATVIAGQPMTYTLTVTNYGPVTGGAVTVTDSLPAGMGFTAVNFVSSSSNTWSCGESAGTVTCTAAAMDPLEELTVTIDAVAPTTGGNILNTASVAIATPGVDSDSTNNSSSVTTTVQTANLTVSKSASSDPVVAGAPFTYTITVANAGTAPASGVSLTDSLPAGVTFQGFTGAGWTCSGTTTISCTFGSPLAPATSTVLTLNVTAPTTGGPITNNVSVATTTPESTTADNSAFVTTTVQTANLTVSKSASPSPVDAGAPLAYTITVGNAGPATASGISLIDNLPAGVIYQGFSGTGWTCTGTTTISCSFASPLASGASTILTLNVLAPPTGGAITNVVSVSTTTPESTTGDNTASVETTVNPPGADLSIAKFGPSTVEPGAAISWTVNVTNLGPGAALSVTVTDTLPSGITLGSVVAPAGWTCSVAGNVVTCSTSSMADSQTAAINITATAPASEGTITNTVTVTTASVDPGSGNNTSSKSTVVDSRCPGGAAEPVSPASGSTEEDTEVTFSWKAVSGAVSYDVILLPADGPQNLVGTYNGSAPSGQILSLVGQAQPGSNVWVVRASFGNNCPPFVSAQSQFFVRSCPGGAPVLISPLDGTTSGSPVTFRWTGVAGAIRYDLYASINSSTMAVIDSVDSDGSGGEFTSTLSVNPGSTVTWFVEAHFPNNCPPTRSAVGGFEAVCFPPIPSVVGEVTSGKPYEVRATIGTSADQYQFQEALDPLFANIVDTKLATAVPGEEYVAAIFEHEVTDPTRYHYRARILNENNCPFSPPTSTAVIPIPDPASLDTDIVVQFGIEEPVTQQILIPSPDPASGLSFTFIAETDREWMTVSPAAGTMGPEGVLFTVVTDPTGLPVGTNTGTVMVTFTAIASGKVAPDGVGTTTSVPVAVSLVTPVTNRGKGSPVAQSLIIPAVAHVDGVGAKWRTDARLVNLGLTPERYFLNFTSSQEDGTRSGKSAEIRLAPGQTTALDDMVKHWYGLGSIAGEGATGVLEIRPLSFTGKTGDGLVTKSLNSIASSRTYAKSGLATMGQFIPALPFSVFVGTQEPDEPQNVLSLQQLAQTSAYRTNLGLVEASGNPAAVEVRFFDAAGGSLLTVPVSLQAGEHRQFNQILAQNGISNLPIGRAEVEVVSGEGRITAYASVVDNATSDPLLVEAVNLANLGASKYVVPGMAHLETGAARWRSDMQIFNAGSASVRATLQFYRTGESTPAGTQQVDLQPGTITSLENVVALFGESNVGGAVQVTTDSSSQLVVTARTFDQQENGTVGQFIPAVTSDDAIGIGERAIQVLQMEESPNIRSNLGVVEVMGQAVTLEISGFAAESRTTPRVQVQLGPNEFRQFNQILRSLNVGNTYNARLSVRVVGGQGRIAAYGSAVDNRTQDPTYVPGQ